MGLKEFKRENTIKRKQKDPVTIARFIFLRFFLQYLYLLKRNVSQVYVFVYVTMRDFVCSEYTERLRYHIRRT